MLSKLIFTQDKRDSINDGFIHTYELFGMNIPNEMAVLSACNTGYGKIIDGEGIISLARGFFYAGSKSVIMSLWSANDKSTTDIMNSFYKYLAEGKQKDEALRFAKLDYLETAGEIKSHPYFWATFIANGNMRPLQIYTTNWLYWIACSFFVILFIVYLYRRRIND